MTSLIAKKPLSDNHILVPLLLLVLCLLVTASSACAAAEFQPPSPDKLAAILKDFEAYAEKSMPEWQTPGMAVAIVKENNVIYTKPFGVKTLGREDPVTTGTIFQIGSTSKAFTAALVSILADEGKITWDDPVISHLPDFVMYDPWVTRQFMVMDLMAQHSGLPPYSADSLVLFGFNRPYIRHAIRFIEPVSSFRSEFAYQNNLFLVAAQLIEKCTGSTWEDNINERIFEPLAMSHSSTDSVSFREAPDVTTLHHKLWDKIIPLPPDWPYLHWTYTYGPAGGINSNITDMANWLKLQVNNGVFDNTCLISSENMQFMHLPKTIINISSGPRQYYCLAWMYRENNPFPIIWHNGGTTGCKTMIALAPEAKIGIVVLSNLIETKLPEALAYRFFDMYFGNPARDWSSEMLAKDKELAEKQQSEIPLQPQPPFPPMPLAKYTGDYHNDVYGKITITENSDGLVLVVGPKKSTMSLKPWNRDTFSVYCPFYDGASDPGWFASFRVAPAGSVTGLTVNVLDEDGCGFFLKQKP